MYNNPKRRTAAQRIISCVMLFILALSCFLPVAAEDSASPSEVNIVLLLDNTGSMNRNDKNRISVAAAKNFVEYLSETMSIAESFGYDLPDINVGVYAFSDKATKISDLTDISDQSNRSDILRKIEGIEFEKRNTGATYYGPALRAAYSALPVTKSDCKNMVFMFTDGKPDGKDANSVLNRPDEAIKAMSEYDIEVMVLGLNSRQSIDDVAKKTIYSMANTTQRTEGIAQRPNSDKTQTSFSKANYLIATAINEDLQRFLMDIISEKIGVKIDKYEGVINVDKREIVIVNIFATSDDIRDIDSVSLFYNNEQVTLTETEEYYDPAVDYEDNTFTITQKDRSAYVTMYAPALGEYTIQLPQNVDYIAYYKEIEITEEYSVSVEAANITGKPNEGSISVTANRIVDGNAESPDGSLLNLIGLKITGETEAHTRSVEFSGLQFNSATGKYDGTFSVGLPGKYKITAVMDEEYVSDSNEKVSSETEIEFVSKTVSDKEQSISIIVGKDKAIDIAADFYTDWIDVGSEHVVASSNSDIASVTEQDGKAVIHANRKGKCVVTNTITDKFGGNHVIVYNVTVTKNYIPMLIIIAAAILAIVAAAIAVSYLTFNKIRGEFYLKRDGVSESLSSWSVRGRSFTAYDLFAKAGFNNISTGDERILKKVRIYVESFKETTDDELNITRKNWRYKVRFGNVVDYELEGESFKVNDNCPEECVLDADYEFEFRRDY